MHRRAQKAEERNERLEARVAALEDPESDAHEKLLLKAIKRGAVTSKSVVTALEAENEELKRSIPLIEEVRLAEEQHNQLRSLVHRQARMLSIARDALERIRNPANWGSDGSWEALSYPDAIARKALEDMGKTDK